MQKKFLNLAILLSLSLFVSAQEIDINDVVGRYTGVNGNSYMQPIADAFGANMNSGLFHSAYIQPGLKPQVYLGIQTMVAIIPDVSKVFTAVTEGDYFPSTEVNDVPTVCGNQDGKIVDGPGGTKYYFPGGFDLSYIPYATPQLTLGSLYGTDVTIRYGAANYFIKNFELEDQNWINEFRMFGWGFRHSISQWLGDLTDIDIAVGYYRQSITSREYLDVRASLISLQASYNKSILTVYGGIGIESSSMKLNYEDSNILIDYNMEGVNSLRISLGATVNAGPVKLNLEYNVSEQSTVAAGLGIGINDFKQPEKTAKEKW